MIIITLTGTIAMPLAPSLVSPLSALLDQIIASAAAREKAKLELLKLASTADLKPIEARLTKIVAEASANDLFTSRARPTFLYVIYAMLLFAIPMGLLSAFEPDIARNISRGMTAYLNGLPEELYVLFGTGYLGYTAARQWGKVKIAQR